MTAVTTDAERVAWATFLRVAEPGVQSLVRHVRAVGVEQTLADITDGSSIAGVDVGALRHRLRTASGAADLERAAAAGARLVCRADEEWPRSLDDLRWVDRDCFGLWVRGDGRLSDAVEQAVAVVGTRAATDYGLHVAADLAHDLAAGGWTIVSGLAYGIDAAAHRGCLAAGGTTVGVLACGVDVVYPKGHRALVEQVLACGLVVSEHPPGAAPQRPRFLVRNRIIAALSVGTLVVEMGLRSGARSTATHAAYLNRHVMCVPGPITSSLSAGCHQLLRDRPDAVVVTRAADVIEQCGHIGELAERESGPSVTRDALGPTVARVFEGVPVRRHASAAAIATTAGVSVDVAVAALAALQAAGLVEQSADGWAMTTVGRSDRRHRTGDDQLALDWW